MKTEEIIEILKDEAIYLHESYGTGSTLYLDECDFEKTAERIVKLFAIPAVSVRDFIIGDVVCTKDGRMWVINEIDGDDLLVDGNGKRNYPLEKGDVFHAH